MKRPRQISFGAVNIHDRAQHVAAWTVNALAKQVREEVGDAYKDPFNGESNTVGWAKAMKAGMRVVKIEVRIIR